MASRYTDQARTRVVDRSRRDAGADAIGNTQFIPQKKGLLDGISAAQIIAAAAAAATSMVLSSHIGIAGSVIGAAVSSVVTVVSSQLYRNFLDAGARKLKDGSILPSTHDARRGAAETQPAHLASTTFDGGTGGRGDAVRAPQPLRGARVAPTKLQARAAAHRSKTQRRVVVFSLAVAVVAVAVYVAVLLWGTAGEGLGAKPAPLFSNTTQSQTQDPAAEGAAATGQTDAAAEAPDGAGTTDDGDAASPAAPTDGDAPATDGEPASGADDGVSSDSSDSAENPGGVGGTTGGAPDTSTGSADGTSADTQGNATTPRTDS